MILKVELIEKIDCFHSSLIVVDFVDRKVTYINDTNQIKEEKKNIDIEKITNLLKKYVVYWENEFVNNKIIDGVEEELILTTTDEIIKYVFKNKYPYNYNEFMKSFKEMVG